MQIRVRDMLTMAVLASIPLAGSAGCGGGGGTGSDGAGGHSTSSGTPSTSSSSGSASAGTGGSASAGTGGSTSSNMASSSSGAGGGSCSGLQQLATTITDQFTSGTVPVGTGGTIADGTYTMTKHITYGPAGTPTTHTYTIRIAGQVMDLLGHDDAKPDIDATFEIMPSPTGAFTDGVTCPAQFAGKKLGQIDSYTATATELHLFESSLSNENVFTLQ